MKMRAAKKWERKCTTSTTDEKYDILLSTTSLSHKNRDLLNKSNGIWLSVEASGRQHKSEKLTHRITPPPDRSSRGKRERHSSEAHRPWPLPCEPHTCLSQVCSQCLCSADGWPGSLLRGKSVKFPIYTVFFPFKTRLRIHATHGTLRDCLH